MPQPLPRRAASGATHGLGPELSSRTIRRRGVLPLTLLGLGILLAVSMLLAVAGGAAPMPLHQALHHLWAGLTGASLPAEDFTDYTVVTDLRAPRVLLAALVGAGLSILGVAGQSMVRNPLADPYILGISAGASVGASAVISWGILAGLGVWGISVAAFLGALGASVLVYLLSATREGLSPVRLVLTGVVLSFGFQAVMSTIVFFEPRGDAARTVMFWLLGSLGGAAWAQVPLVAGAVLVCLGYLVLRAPDLDVLSLGDATCASMGVDPRRLRRNLFLVTVLGTGIMVSVSGAIGFVGLVVPHLTRLLVGPSHRPLLLLSPLLGALFMVWVDLISRSVVPPRELPLGVFTALIGVPVFVVLIRRRGYVFGGSR